MKRFLRFRLKTLLALVTLLSLYLGWHVYSTNRQKQAVGAIRNLGGWVYYDFQIVDDKFDPNGQSWVPERIRSRLGVDFFHSVVQVNMVYNDDGKARLDNNQTSGDAMRYVGQLKDVEVLLLKEGQATDENLQYVAGLPRLRRLYMWDAANVSDFGIQQLGKLKNLKYVHCSEARLTDVSLDVFGRMPQLDGLSLQGNRFTDLGLERLKSLSNLNSLWIGRGETRITDVGLKHVYGLKKLREFDVQGSPITMSGLQELQKAIPRLKVYHGLTDKPNAAVATAAPNPESPLLCFLSDKHDPPSDEKQPWPGTYWRPDGTLVEGTDALQPLRATASVFTKSNEPHLNIFVLTRDTQHRPFGEIDLLDLQENVIDERLLKIHSYHGQPVAGTRDMYWQQFLVPIPKDKKFPDRGTIRIRYVPNDWESLSLMSATEDHPSINHDGLVHVATGESLQKKAFVSLYVDKKDGDRYEYRLVGRDKKNAAIQSTGFRRAEVPRESYVLTFEFGEPLAKFKDFELLGRPKFTAEFCDVSFHLGIITSPVMRQPDGTLTAPVNEK